MKSSRQYLFFTIFLLFFLSFAGAQTVGELSSRYTTQKELISGMQRWARNEGFTTKDIDLNTGRDFHTFEESLEIRRQGQYSEELIFCLPLGKEPAIHWYNVKAAMIILRTAKEIDFPFSLRVALLGAEETDNPNNSLGTRELLRRFLPSNPAGFIYGHFPGPGSTVNMDTGTNGIVVSRHWLEPIYRGFTDAGWKIEIPQNIQQLYRFSLADKEPAVSPYIRAGYPAVGFTAAVDDTSEEEWSARVEAIIPALKKDLRRGMTRDTERHYLTVDLTNIREKWFLTIPETIFIYGILLFFATALAYPLIATRRVSRYARIFRRKMWTIPFLFLVIYGSFTAGTGLISILTRLKGSELFWMENGGLLFFLKFFFAIFLILLSFKYLIRLPLARQGSFYSASALLFFLFNIFAAGSINIALSYILLTSYFFGCIFSLAPGRITKALILPFTMILPAKLFWNFFQVPSIGFTRGVLLSWGYGNLALSLFLMPYLFLIIRVFLSFHIKSQNQDKVKIGLDLITGIGALGLGLFAWFQPLYTDTAPEKLTAVEAVDLKEGNQILTIEEDRYGSPWALIHPDYRFSRSWLEKTRITNEWAAKTTRDPETVKIRTENFLNRTLYEIVLEDLSSASEILIEIVNPENTAQGTLVYDSTFPFQQAPDGRSAQIHIGANPPERLICEVILPRDFPGSITLKAEFPGILSGAMIQGEKLKVEGSTVLTQILMDSGVLMR